MTRCSKLKHAKAMWNDHVISTTNESSQVQFANLFHADSLYRALA